MYSFLKVMIRNLWFGETLKKAVDSPRFHHQIYPMALEFEDQFPEVICHQFIMLRT